MTAESADDGGEPHDGASRHRPPFPVFPIVFPLIFPIGVMTFLSRRRDRRERALELRLEEVEQRLDNLAGTGATED